VATEEEVNGCKAAIIELLASCEIQPDRSYLNQTIDQQPFQHDCYKASFEYLISRNESEDVLLVHGQVQPADTDHAWVEFHAQNMVYDATLLRFYRRPCYYQIRGAKILRTYKCLEAFRRFTDMRHYGPWSE
jgi:hypothetical protein